MAQRITQVDAFTSAPFAGNPAAVCVLPAVRDEVWMQQVAAEMNLAETAFLVRREDGFDLRWFTPLAEVDLCGHATLASAHVLWEEGHLQAGAQARFHTKSGLLTADRGDSWIELDFPATPAEAAPVPPGMAEALGVPSQSVGRTSFGRGTFGRTSFDYLVEVASEDEVRALTPDITALRKLPVRGVIVTSRAAMAGIDFVSRFFAPAVGVNEDPVTGSAHCALGPYWGERLNKNDLIGYQASSRGGVVRVSLRGDRVRLGGQAVTVLRGELV